jgi:hypothetical protein
LVPLALAAPLNESLLLVRTNLPPITEAAELRDPRRRAPLTHVESSPLRAPDGETPRAVLTVDPLFVNYRVVRDDPALAADQDDILQRTEQLYWSNAAVLVALLLVSAPLARRAVLSGRADVAGANRTAALMLAVRLAASLLLATHPGGAIAESRLLLLAASGAIVEAAVVWVFYVALEPWVRLYWPQTLISWTRLMSGRGRDSLVGLHLLLGCVMGAVWTVLVRMDSQAGDLWESLIARVPIHPDDFFASLLSLRGALGVTLEALRSAAYYGLLLLLLIVLLRRLTGRPLASGAIAAALLAALFLPRTANPAIAIILFGVGVTGVAAAAMIRFGFLCVFTGIVVLQLLNRAPLELNVRAWYVESAAIALLSVLAIAIVGFWWAVSGRRGPVVRLTAAREA